MQTMVKLSILLCANDSGVLCVASVGQLSSDSEASDCTLQAANIGKDPCAPHMWTGAAEQQQPFHV